MTNLTFKEVEVWVLIDHMSTSVVLGGIDPLAAGKLAAEASILHLNRYYI